MKLLEVQVVSNQQLEGQAEPHQSAPHFSPASCHAYGHEIGRLQQLGGHTEPQQSALLVSQSPSHEGFHVPQQCVHIETQDQVELQLDVPHQYTPQSNMSVHRDKHSMLTWCEQVDNFTENSDHILQISRYSQLKLQPYIFTFPPSCSSPPLLPSSSPTSTSCFWVWAFVLIHFIEINSPK